MPLPSSSGRVQSVVGPFRVLTVCTGNVCRSPLAEALLRDALAPLGGDLLVSSAGTSALVDAPADPPAAEEALRLGADVSAHQARWLVEAHVRDASLVLGMAREHRSAATRLHPAAGPRSFTLLEFAAVLSALEQGAPLTHAANHSVPQRLAAVVAAAASARGRVVSELQPELDIVDPYRRGAQVHRDSADATAEAARAASASLLRLVG